MHYAAIFAWLMSIALPVVVNVLKGLGFGLVTYGVSTVAIDFVTSRFLSEFNNMPADMLQILLLTKIDIGLKMILSAVSAKIAIKAFMTAGNAAGQSTRVVWKKPLGGLGDGGVV